MSQISRFTSYWHRINKWIASFPTSLIIGLLLGIVLALVLQSLSSFIAGVVLGIILEQVFLGVKHATEEWRNTNPLRMLLGPIATDDECYIFFSSFQRDLSRPNEYKLARWDARQARREILITGPDFVLGESDALALSLIQSLLARVPKKPEKVKVERGDEELDKWGVNAFCIGAHNGKTRVILEKFQNPFFRFDSNYTVITKPGSPTEVDQRTQEQIRKGVYITQRGDAEPTDYGIVLKFQDQFRDNGKTIFVIPFRKDY